PPPRPPLFPYTTLFRSPAHAPRLRVREWNARRRRRGTNRLPACTQPVTVTRRQSRAMKLTPSLTFGVVYSVPQHSPLDAWSCTVDRKSTRLNSSHLVIS